MLRPLAGIRHAAKRGIVDLAKSLVDQGRLREAELLLRALHAIQPQLIYARTMCTVFDRMPASQGISAPRDDPAKDVQIVRGSDSDAVVLAFCGGNHRFGFPMPLIHRWFGRLPAHVIYLRDWQGRFFQAGIPSLGADRTATLEALRTLIADLGGRRIFCCGTSAGVFGALDYGLTLGAKAVLCLAGPTDLSDVFNRGLRYAGGSARVRQELPSATLDIRAAYGAADAPPRVLFVYGTANWDDRIHAMALDGVPGVRFFGLEGFAGHSVLAESLLGGHLETMLAWLFEPDAFPRVAPSR